MVPVATSRADNITLTNGRVIEADHAWYEGAEVRYQKNGGVFGLPRALVARVDAGTATPASKDPDLAAARDRLAAGQPAEAEKLLRGALARDPRSIAILQALAESYLAMGDPLTARQVADRAVRLDDRNPRSRALRGDALAAIGDRIGAEQDYRQSLKLRPDPLVEKKLAAVAPAPVPSAPFRLHSDGIVSEAFGSAVLGTLNTAYAEYAKRLGFRPDQPVTVVLQTESAFQDGRTPEWAAGLNDGTIRVPVGGLVQITPALQSVLRHELGHSFIAARTGGNCPTWLQEGISQWLEGGDPAREDALVAGAMRDGRLRPLLTLEGPFQGLPTSDATLAYAESLSAVNHIVKRRGEAGLVRLLAALGDGFPTEEALPISLALTYGELQKSWERQLLGEGALGTGARR
jgi:tetratricopeptide (TPR) repeat protein